MPASTCMFRNDTGDNRTNDDKLCIFTNTIISTHICWSESVHLPVWSEHVGCAQVADYIYLYRAKKTARKVFAPSHDAHDPALQRFIQYDACKQAHGRSASNRLTLQMLLTLSTGILAVGCNCNIPQANNQIWL